MSAELVNTSESPLEFSLLVTENALKARLGSPKHSSDSSSLLARLADK